MLFGIIDVTKQPFKRIFVLLSNLGATFICTPLWTLQSLLPSWRARSSWPIRRCVQVKRAKFDEWLDMKVGRMVKWPSYEELELNDGELGLWVQGVSELLTGEVKDLADVAGTRVVQIPGYWQHKPDKTTSMGEKPKEGEKVLYFLHGGGYIVLSAHPKSPTSAIARTIMVRSPPISRTFAIEYRLSSWDPNNCANPFPAALIDALMGYNYLVNEVGYTPSNIIVCGDSAGANLALALTRYLVENPGVGLGVPGGLVLLSPWSDLTGSHAVAGSSEYTCVETDFLAPSYADRAKYAPRAFVGPHGADFASNPYISPAAKTLENVNFKGFPRPIIVSGDAEVFLDQIRTLKDRMVAEMGSDQVTYLESEGAFHDFIGFSWFEPQRGEALEAIGHWIEEL